MTADVKMPVRIGEVEALYRYPVKSMAGESLGAVQLVAVGQPVFFEPSI